MSAQITGQSRSLWLHIRSLLIFFCNVSKQLVQKKRVSENQFGFKSGTGTIDALFLARRAIDKAIKQSSPVFLIAIDWAKAFDSLMPHALYRALHRFGIPSDMIAMIQQIYSDRLFFVRDRDHESSQRHQHSGIIQGCPLSPFLFTITMTILMQDV